MKAFIQDSSGDHNFDYSIENQTVKEFVGHIRQQGGYYVPSEKGGKVDGVIFVPWHQIHFIRFTEEEG